MVNLWLWVPVTSKTAVYGGLVIAVEVYPSFLIDDGSDYSVAYRRWTQKSGIPILVSSPFGILRRRLTLTDHSGI